MDGILDSQEDPPGTLAHQSALLPDICASQSEWLSQWSQHVSVADQLVRVPNLARNVKTPLDVSAWNHYISNLVQTRLCSFLSKESLKGSGLGVLTGRSTVSPRERTCNQLLSTYML